MYELVTMKKFDYVNLKENVRRNVLKLMKQLTDIGSKNKYKKNIVKIMHNFDFL